MQDAGLPGDDAFGAVKGDRDQRALLPQGLEPEVAGDRDGNDRDQPDPGEAAGANGGLRRAVVTTLAKLTKIP